MGSTLWSISCLPRTRPFVKVRGAPASTVYFVTVNHLIGYENNPNHRGIQQHPWRRKMRYGNPLGGGDKNKER